MKTKTWAMLVVLLPLTPAWADEQVSEDPKHSSHVLQRILTQVDEALGEVAKEVETLRVDLRRAESDLNRLQAMKKALESKPDGESDRPQIYTDPNNSNSVILPEMKTVRLPWDVSTTTFNPKPLEALLESITVTALEKATTGPSPVTYKMQLIRLTGTEPSEWVFVVGQVGFKSLDSFKEFVGRLPKGSTLEWAPGCKRIGVEPLLSSEEEMEGFRKFCEERGIRFVLVPSG